MTPPEKEGEQRRNASTNINQEIAPTLPNPAELPRRDRAWDQLLELFLRDPPLVGLDGEVLEQDFVGEGAVPGCGAGYVARGVGDDFARVGEGDGDGGGEGGERDEGCVEEAGETHFCRCCCWVVGSGGFCVVVSVVRGNRSLDGCEEWGI